MSVIEKIIEAGKEKKTLMITYTDSKGSASTRETEPYEIKDGMWYFGYCLQNKGIRKFEISRISSAQKTTNSFNPRWELKF